AGCPGRLCVVRLYPGAARLRAGANGAGLHPRSTNGRKPPSLAGLVPRRSDDLCAAPDLGHPARALGLRRCTDCLAGAAQDSRRSVPRIERSTRSPVVRRVLGFPRAAGPGTRFIREEKQVRTGTLAIGGATLLFVLGFAPVVTQAQQYPTQDIHFICAFPPGSGADVLVRYFADKVRPLTGKNVIVENRSGAGGNIAIEYVSRAKPDGYTI